MLFSILYQVPIVVAVRSFEVGTHAQQPRALNWNENKMSFSVIFDILAQWPP